MTRIVTFDICAIFTLTFLIISLFIRKVTKGRANKMFLLLVGMLLFSTILSVFRFSLEFVLSPSEFSKIIVYTVHYLYLLSRNLCTPIYTLFLFSVCGLWHYFRSKKLLHFFWALPVVLIVFTIIADLFVHKLFIIDENLSFIRGPLMYVLYTFSFYCLIYSVCFLIHYRKNITKLKFLVMIFLYPVAFAGIIAQMIVPHILFESFAMTFPMLIISMVVQRPEEIINIDTGSLNYHACVDQIEQNFRSNTPMSILFFQLTEFNKNKKKIREEIINQYLESLIERIYSITGSNECDVFYLDNGLFATISTNVNKDKFLENCKKISEMVSTGQLTLQGTFFGEVKLCYVNCPDDFSNENKLMDFGRNMNKSISKVNQLVILSEEMKSKDFQIRYQLDSLINKAIKNHNFQMYFQPIYDIKKKKFSSAEALIRLIDDEYGFISPALFIPAAENSGAIHKIGDYVLDEVFNFIYNEKLQDLGIEYIEINLSVAQCIEKNLYEKVSLLLDKYSLDPKSVNFEITETAVDINHEVSDFNIYKLSEKGIDFSLDDYGTGYSNIKRVVSLPLNIIKLDKSFADEYENPDMKVVIKSTVNMLKKINKEILIEGVEDEKCASYFSEVGCNYIQGYYYSKPLPKKEFVEFIKKNNIGDN